MGVVLGRAGDGLAAGQSDDQVRAQPAATRPDGAALHRRLLDEVAMREHADQFDHGLLQFGNLRVAHPAHRQRPFARLLLPARARSVAGQAQAMDHAGAKNRDIDQILAPDQAVVPMAMAEILIKLLDPCFGQVIVPGMPRRIGRLDHRADQHTKQQVRQKAFGLTNGSDEERTQVVKRPLGWLDHIFAGTVGTATTASQFRQSNKTFKVEK